MCCPVLPCKVYSPHVQIIASEKYWARRALWQDIDKAAASLWLWVWAWSLSLTVNLLQECCSSCGYATKCSSVVFIRKLLVPHSHTTYSAKQSLKAVDVWRSNVALIFVISNIFRDASLYWNVIKRNTLLAQLRPRVRGDWAVVWGVVVVGAWGACCTGRHCVGWASLALRTTKISESKSESESDAG